MKTNKIFNGFMIVLLVTMASGGAANVFAQELNPEIGVIYNTDAVAIWGWVEGGQITLTIDDPSNGVGVDYTDTQEAIESVFYTDGNFDIQPGQLVTVTDGTTTKETIVTDVEISSVDPITNIVFGTADPFDPITVAAWWNCGYQSLNVSADVNGDWMVDFSGACDIIPNTTVGAYEYDSDGDSTRFDWRVPNPSFSVRPELDWVDGWEWEAGETITLSIDDPNNGLGIDFSTSEQITDSSLSFQIGDFYDIKPDDIVTVYGDMSDVIKEHIVNHVSITNVDLDTQTVFGVASSNVRVEVDIHKDCAGAQNNVDVTSDEYGNWEADFSGLCSINQGDHLGAKEWDDDGDYTMFDYDIFSPQIVVSLHRNAVIDQGWPEGETLTLSIDDPSNGLGEDYSAQIIAGQGETFPHAYLGFALYDQFQIRSGHIVTVSGGGYEITYIVDDPQITSIDFENDLIFGTCSPETEIRVSSPSGQRWILVDSNGDWSVDLSEYGTSPNEQYIDDLTPQSEIPFACYNRDSNFSETENMYPVFIAVNVHGDISGSNWTIGQPVLLEIDDPGTQEFPDFSDHAWPAPGPWYLTDINIPVAESIDVQPGFVVTATQGERVKTHIVTNVGITETDVEYDTVSGIAAPYAYVSVVVGGNDSNRIVRADGAGNWTANFSIPGTLPWEDVFDITAGANILALEWDDDSDHTGVYWQIPNPKIGIRPAEDRIEGWEWELGAIVDIEIDDPGTPESPDYSDTVEVVQADWDPNQTTLDLQLWDVYDIKPGDIITATDGTLTKAHTVTSLTMDIADVDTDTVAGSADPGSRVDIWICDDHGCANRHVDADGGGQWTADFANPGIEDDEQDTRDIVPGTWIDSSQNDEDGDGTYAGIYLNNPTFRINPNLWEVEVWEWPLDVPVTLNIDDPSNGPGVDYTDTQFAFVPEWDPNSTYIQFDFRDLFDVLPGFIVTLSDGSITKEHVVSNQVVTSIDPLTDQVTGTAEPGTELLAHICNEYGCTELYVMADEYGNWIADYSGLYDLVPGTNGTVIYYDEDGDATGIFWEIPNPTFGVRANHDNIEGWQWDEGATVTLTIDDPSTPENPDYGDTTTVGYADWDPNQTWFTFELGGVYDIQVGDLVTVSDGEITKEHTVLNLAFTDFDTDADVVFGIGVPDSQINVWTCDDFGCINREEFTDGSGNWSVDFSVPGDQDWEQETADLRGGSWVDSSQSDEDGDQTMFGINIPNYNITAFPVDDAVEAWEWTEGNTVYLTIDDPNTPESPDFEREGIAEVTWWGDSRTYVRFDFYDEYDLKAGDLVTVTDGNILRSHVVLELALTNVDPATDTITGTAVPGSMVVVWPHEYDQDATLEVETDQDGVWMADFTGLFDLASGIGGRSQIEDEAGNATAVDWNVLSYTLHAVPSYPEVHGHDWEPGSDVTLIIDDDLDPNNGILYEDTRNVDDDPWCGNPCFDLSGVFDLQVGHYVTMSDDTVSKTVLVSQLTVTEVNYENDTVSGVADPGSRVAVNIWSQEGNARYVTADGAGLWVADFSQVGDEDFEQELADIQEWDWGRAIQLNPDGSDDGTLEYWGEGPSIWEAPDDVPLVAAISSNLDLNRLGFDYEAWVVANLLWEPLFRTTDQGDLMPAAASDYSVSPDGLIYTITLRDDALWSDGTPVEAQHFVDGFLRLISPDTATDYGYLLYEIEGSEAYGLGETSDTSTVGLLALNNQTLQITLHRPAAYFIKVLANPGMIPARADLLGEYGDGWVDPNNFVGNGPYTLMEYDNSHLLVEKNQNFHDADQLTFNQIGLAVISDEGQRVDAYHEGLVDVILSVSTDAAKDPDLAAERYTRALGIYFVGLNTEKPPLDNPLVRKALASAIDRPYLFEEVFETPWTQSATGVIPPDIPGYQGDAVGYTFDAVQAQTYLSDAGYPGGDGFPEIVLYVNDGQSISMEYVAEQWRTVLGIPVRVEYTDWSDYIAHLRSCHENPASCNYHAYRLGWFVDYYDAYSILGDVFHPDANFSLWESTLYRDLIDLSLSELDPAQRVSYLQQAEQVLVEDETAAIPIGFADQISLTKQAFEPAFGLVPYLDLWSYAPPTIGVYAADESMPNNEVVEIYNWMGGEEVSIIIDDPATPEIGDYFETRTAQAPPEYFKGMYPDAETIARFELAGGVDLEPGFTISVEGAPGVSYTVRDLSITNMDLGLDTLSGTSAANEQIDLNVCNNYDPSECVGFSVVADGGGTWQADFGAWGFDLQVGSEGSAWLYDEDGNRTMVDFSVLTSAGAGFTPTSEVVVQPGETINLAAAVDLTGPVTFIGEDAIRALQMAIEDHGPIAGFDVQFAEFDGACDFASGEQAALQVVSDSSIVGVIGHTCSSSVKGSAPIYEEAGLVTISGSATMPTAPAYGPTVFSRTVFSDFDYDSTYWIDELEGFQSVQAWSYDFEARFGVEPADFAVLYYDAARLLLERIEETAVLQGGGELVINRAALAAAVRDTAVRQADSGCWSLGYNGSRQECGGGLVNISYTEKLIWAPFWGIGDELTLHIYDQNDNLIYNPEPQVVAQAWFATDFDFPHAIFFYGDEFEMQPGYRAVVSNGEITKETVATELELGMLDAANDQVSGTASPGSHIFVEAWQFGVRRHTLADGAGNWFVDFASPGNEAFEGDVLDIEVITALDVAQFTGENKTYLASPIGEIRGTVLLDGQPLSDVEVWVNGPIFNGERYNWYVCTDANGEFVVEKTPPGPVDGFISATGPSVAIGCANAEFLDENGVPLMVQFWDHVDGIPEATFFDFDPLAQPHGNPYIELQYDIVRATAMHDVYTTVHIVDQAGAGACPLGEAECDLPLNSVEIDAYAGSEWVYRWSSGWPPFGEGNSQFRYKTVSDLTLNATYLDLDSGQELVATLPVGAAEFVDRGDGVFVAPTLTFNFIKVIAPDGSISLYFDTDGDHIADGDDNAPEDYNPDQRDVDGDGVADVLDPCPDDDADACDTGASGSDVVGSDGGIVETLDSGVSLSIPAGALSDEISFSITESGAGYELTSDDGVLFVLQSYSIQPEGTIFDPPALLTMHWNDADDDGIIDGTSYEEANIVLMKDGVIQTNASLDLGANLLTLEIGSLSLFELAVFTNSPPTADAGPDQTVYEGDPVTLSGAGSTDPDNDELTYAWDLDNDGAYDDANGVTVNWAFADDGIYTVGLQVTDPGGLTDTDTAEIVVLNVAPQITAISAPIEPTQVGQLVETSAFFTDPGIEDSHTAIWDWGDGTLSGGLVSGYYITGAHQYTIPGVYTLTLTLADDDGGVATELYQYVVVFDPDGGFVTGGGWFTDPETSDKASFGFNAKYNMDAKIPFGNTHFKVGDLRFESTAYDWLVVSGERAQFHGVGTVNDISGYSFFVTIIDGKISGDGDDYFRIKIWDISTGMVLYDNHTNLPDVADPLIAIKGGSIVIHK